MIPLRQRLRSVRVTVDIVLCGCLRSEVEDVEVVSSLVVHRYRGETSEGGFWLQGLDSEHFGDEWDIKPPKAIRLSISIGNYVLQTKTQAAVNVKMEASQSSIGAQVHDSIDAVIVYSE